MALATNSTPGSIVLAGDLTGTAASPQLRITGVVPGAYSNVNVAVDGKGRVVYAHDGVFVPPEDATTSVAGIMQVGSGLVVADGVVSVPNATTGTKGIMQVGSGLAVTGGVVSAPDATTSSKGIVQVGSGLAVTGGVVSIPDATAGVKGIVQIGSGLAVTGGVVSVDTSNPTQATTSVKGVVQIGDGLTVSSGIAAATGATSTTKGTVQIGTNLTATAGAMNIGTNIPKLNATNTFTSYNSSPVKTITNADYAIDLALFNDFYRADGIGTSVTLASPTNASTNVWNIVADCGTDPMYMWPATATFTASGGSPSGIVDLGDRYWCISYNTASGTYLSGGVGAGIVSSTFPSSADWRYIGTANAKIFGLAGNTSSSGIVSTDGGVSWSSFSFASSSQWGNAGISYGGGSYVGLAYDGSATVNYAYSSNGTSWSSSTFPTSDTWVKCFYAASKFVVFGLNGYMWSTNGISGWTDVSYPTASHKVAYNLNGTLVLTSGGYSNTFYTSANGTTWNLVAAPATTGWVATYKNGVYLINNTQTGVQSFITSSDGSTWSNQSSPIDSAVVIVGNALFCYDTTSVYMSTTGGSSWSLVYTGTNIACDPVYNGTRYFIVDKTSATTLRVISSSDNFSSSTQSDVTAKWTMSSIHAIGNSTSGGVSIVVANSTSIWDTFTLTGLSLSFGSSYKFNNSAPATGTTTINCVTSGSDTYCTFS